MTKRVVGFEGGPCSGKTTAIDFTAAFGKEIDIETTVVSEVATKKLGELSLRGLSYGDIVVQPSLHYEFQRGLLGTIIDDILIAIDKASDNSVILVDRVDIASYISPTEYSIICADLGYSEPPMNTLVDTLIYFPTVAKKDISLYENIRGGNPLRYESARQAISTCDANLQTVRNHPDFWFVSEDDFERQLRYAANIAFKGIDKENDPLELVIA